MREVVLRIPRLAVEDVLDRLLPLVPGGVREGRDGPHVTLRMRGTNVPANEVIVAAVGRWPHTLAEREVSDDWRQRRLADYEPLVIGQRLVVRPDWAPPAEGRLMDVELAETAAFGGGTHPTTRTCLEWLLGITPAGAFADLGCGSGVLAIVAAKLGWEPVSVVDVQPGIVETARLNAERNGVSVAADVADLTQTAPPISDGFAANVPAWLHGQIAEMMPEPLPRIGLLSGFGIADNQAVLQAYDARGLTERRRTDQHGWSVVELRRN